MIGREIPVVFRKLRAAHERFSCESVLETLHETSVAYSSEEVEQLVRFAASYGLDYGELDVLRDVHDGRIYVVDVNSTPWGPAELMTPQEIESAILRLAPAFARLLRLPSVRGA